MSETTTGKEFLETEARSAEGCRWNAPRRKVKRRDATATRVVLMEVMRSDGDGDDEE